MNGKALTNNILLALGNGGTTLYSQETGFAWVDGTGRKDVQRAARTQQVTLQKGDVVLRKAHMIRMGLCEGSADVIGHETITITPEMVGQKIAVFTAVEVKGDNDRPRPKQVDFVNHVKAAGGRAGFAYSVDDARKIINGDA